MSDGTRLTIREMTARDWRALAEALPLLDDCSECQYGLKFLAWLEGGGSEDFERKQLRRIRGGLIGALHAGPFRVERAGRWGIVFVCDPALRGVSHSEAEAADALPVRPGRESFRAVRR